MRNFLSDVRYAVRMWSRSPGFVFVAVATLALGIGANTTMFSIVNATLLRPLAYPDPDRLVVLWEGRASNPDPNTYNIFSLPDYRDLKARSRTLSEVAIFDSGGSGYNLTSSGEPEQVSGVRVTASFFRVLGVSPFLGRNFTEDEEQPGRDRVVILSYGLWTRRYGADRTLVGRPITINGTAYTVAGVMPAGFQFQFWSGERQLWVPGGWTVGDQERGSHSFLCIGRMKPGVNLEQTRAEVDTIGRAISKENPAQLPDGTVRLEALQETGVTDLKPGLTLMLAVVGFVLLIACVNVANLMLARAAGRSRELAIRAAIGASARRLIRQLLTESLVLSAVGGAAGILLAVWGTSLIVPLLPGEVRFAPMRPADQIGVDWMVLAFTAAISIASGLFFGVAPAVATLRSDLNHPLKDSARGSTGSGRATVRHALVAAEVALTLVVLAGAGLMVASLGRLLRVDPGLDSKNVLVMELSLPQENLYYGPPVNRQFCTQLDQQVSAVPGVRLGERDRPPAARRRKCRTRRCHRGPARSGSSECPGGQLHRGLPERLADARHPTRQRTGVHGARCRRRARRRADQRDDGQAVLAQRRSRRQAAPDRNPRRSRRRLAHDRRRVRRRPTPRPRSDHAAGADATVQPGSLAVDEHRDEDRVGAGVLRRRRSSARFGSSSRSCRSLS